jgi:hypothetical protein
MASGPGAAGNGAAVASGEESPLVYKVQLPPKSNPVTQVLKVAKETFFYDDSFRQFKHQSKRNRSILGIKYVFPILEWLPHYTFKKLIGDFVAGLTIASLAVPQASNQFLISCSPYSLFHPVLAFLTTQEGFPNHAPIAAAAAADFKQSSSKLQTHYSPS